MCSNSKQGCERLCSWKLFPLLAWTVLAGELANSKSSGLALDLLFTCLSHWKIKISFCNTQCSVLKGGRGKVRFKLLILTRVVCFTPCMKLDI